MDIRALSNEQELSTSGLSSALRLLLLLGAVLLAVCLLVLQSLLPSRREVEVMDAFAGRLETPQLLQGDFLEWELSRCEGFCPVYRLRMDRQGRVEFEGFLFTCRTGIHRRQVDAAQAQAVLRAATVALRGAANEGRTIDAPRARLIARLAGQVRQVELILGSDLTQLHLKRLLTLGKETLLDPRWLPIWNYPDVVCLSDRGERIPFDLSQANASQ